MMPKHITVIHLQEPMTEAIFSTIRVEVDFPSGPGVTNPPANTGVRSSTPGWGRKTPQAVRHAIELILNKRSDTAVRISHSTISSLCSPPLDKAHTQQQRPSVWLSPKSPGQAGSLEAQGGAEVPTLVQSCLLAESPLPWGRQSFFT